RLRSGNLLEKDQPDLRDQVRSLVGLFYRSSREAKVHARCQTVSESKVFVLQQGGFNMARVVPGFWHLAETGAWQHVEKALLRGKKHSQPMSCYPVVEPSRQEMTKRRSVTTRRQS